MRKNKRARFAWAERSIKCYLKSLNEMIVDTGIKLKLVKTSEDGKNGKTD
jgi:hypothetical protein